MRAFLYFAILAVSQNAICKSFELFCFLKFFSIFSQKNSSKTGSEALTCFGFRNLGRSVFPFLTLWTLVPEARAGIKNHGAFASWFRADRTWILIGIAKAGWILSQLKPNAPFRSKNKFHGFSFVFREKAIIFYSFIYSVLQVQRKPPNRFATIWRLFFGATGRTWTGDLLITNQLLYQLSHSSIPINMHFPAQCNLLYKNLGTNVKHKSWFFPICAIYPFC